MRTPLALGWILACLVGAGEAERDPWAEGAALVFSARGEVRLVKEGSDAKTALRTGDPLVAGDRVQVADGGETRLLYRDGRLVTVESGAAHEVGAPAEDAGSALWEAVAAKFRRLAGEEVALATAGAVRGERPPELPPLAPMAPLASWVLDERPDFRWVPHPEATLYRHRLERQAEDRSWQAVWQGLEWREAALPYPYGREPLTPGVYRWAVTAVVGDKEVACPEKGFLFRLPGAEERRAALALVEGVASALPPDLAPDCRWLLLGNLWEGKGVFVYHEAAEHYRRVLEADPGHGAARVALVELYARIGVAVR